MSYTIEYARQFIRSEKGITPCWLAGDNNVTEPTLKGRERCARSWSVFHNLLGVTEQDILDSIQDTLGGYGEHWKRNGKWVDDAGLIRWIKNGCKQTATVEEIIGANRMRSLSCHVSVWGPEWKHETMLNKGVSTTEEFDAWIVDVEALRAEMRAKGPGYSVYPVVDFYVEKLNHPRPVSASTPEKVIVRRGNGRAAMYLAELSRPVQSPNSWRSSWCKDIKKAMVLQYDEAMRLRTEVGLDWIRKGTLLDASAKDAPYNAAIRFVDGVRAGEYIFKNTGHRIFTTTRAEGAYRYKDRKTAEQALKTLQPKFQHVGTLEVAIVEEKEKES